MWGWEYCNSFICKLSTHLSALARNSTSFETTPLLENGEREGYQLSITATDELVWCGKKSHPITASIGGFFSLERSLRHDWTPEN